MTIIAPDPFPGRCKNHRTELRNWQFVTLRCLDYEAVPHQCSFEKPTLVPSVFEGYTISNNYSAPPPEPWVKPAPSKVREG